MLSTAWQCLLLTRFDRLEKLETLTDHAKDHRCHDPLADSDPQKCVDKGAGGDWWYTI